MRPFGGGSDSEEIGFVFKAINVTLLMLFCCFLIYWIMKLPFMLLCYVCELIKGLF